MQTFEINGNATKELVNSIAKFTHLKSLRVSSCDFIKKEDWPKDMNCKNTLEYLNLKDTNVSSEFLNLLI
jgi:hypothetical protein